MAAPTTVDEAIEQAGLGPASVTNTDGQSVTSKDVGQLLQARDAVAAQTARQKDKLGVYLRKLVPDGMP